MATRARYEQPCMAYCGQRIYIDMWIEKESNGWQHLHCPDAEPPPPRTPPTQSGMFVCWNCKQHLPLTEHAIGNEFKRCTTCHERITAERDAEV